MRFFKYLVFIFVSIFSVSAFAVEYQYWLASANDGKRYSSASAACLSYKTTRPDAANWLMNDTALPTKCQYNNGSAWMTDIQILKEPIPCPAANTEDVKSVPFRLRNSQVCIDSCLWNPIATGGMVCGQGSGICATDFKSAGSSCSQNTDLTPTQDDKNSTTDNPDPNDPDPNDNNSNNNNSNNNNNNSNNNNSNNNNNNSGSGGCTSNCNNTTNNYNFDVSQITAAISAQTSSILGAISAQTAAINNAISNINSAITSGFKSVTDAIGITNSKLDLVNAEQIKTNEKLDISNDHLQQIEESGKAASETLGTIDSKLKESNEHLKKLEEQGHAASELLTSIDNGIAKIEENTAAASETLGDIKKGVDESNSIWKSIKDWLFDENGSSVSNVDLPTEGIAAGQIDYNLFKVNAQCPASPHLLVSLSHVSKSFNIDYTQLCDILRYMGYLISIVAALHAGQILVRDS